MDTNIARLPAFEATTNGWIHLVGTCIEIFGVFIIVVGIAWSTLLCVHWRKYNKPYDEYKYASAAPCCWAWRSWSPRIS